MASSPPVILFDLDGTLIDTAADLGVALNKVLAEKDVPPISMDLVRNAIGRGGRVLIERGLALNGQQVSKDELDRLVSRFLDHYRKDIAVHSKPYPGAMEAVERLKDAGATVAICTNKMEDMSLALLAELGILDRFAMVAGADTHPVRKPDAGHLTLTIKKIGGDPARVFMVGDSITDIHAARNAVMPVVGVSFGYTETPMTDLDPDFLIDHMDELWPVARQILKLA
ncbi:MAG: phosphoglycolate phosphatase [Fimbriimonadaceae bacterium]|nr:phosphoglycolate phosphatase [Alphaproteobacteria bacterium]